VRASDTIEEVKRLFAEARDIPEERLVLIFAGRTLEDSRTFGDYNIQKESTLFMVLRFRRG
jgi:hypothetical protein